MVTEFDRLFQYDPVLEAERTMPTAHPVARQTLAMELAYYHDKELTDELLLRDDTYRSITMERAYQVFERLGFTEAYSYGVNDDDMFTIMWNQENSILLTMNSEKGKLYDANIWYNWKPNDPNEFLSLAGVGMGIENTEGDVIWCGADNVSEAADHTLMHLKDGGEFVTDWVYAPHVQLVDPRVDDALNRDDVIAELPGDIVKIMKLR